MANTEIKITFSQREIMANIAALSSIEIITKEIISRFDMECMGAELDLIEAMKNKLLVSQQESAGV